MIKTGLHIILRNWIRRDYDHCLSFHKKDLVWMDKYPDGFNSKY